MKDGDEPASLHHNKIQCIQSMLNGIDRVHSPTKYTYIAVRLTGALIICKSNDKESFGQFFSWPHQYTSSILEPNQSIFVVGVATYSKLYRQEYFH